MQETKLISLEDEVRIRRILEQQGVPKNVQQMLFDEIHRLGSIVQNYEEAAAKFEYISRNVKFLTEPALSKDKL